MSAGYDAPGAFVALVCFDLAQTLTRYRRPLAAHLARTADVATWALVAIDADALGMMPQGAYRRETVRRAVELMAEGRADETAALLADECGLRVEDWAEETRREMVRAQLA